MTKFIFPSNEKTHNTILFFSGKIFLSLIAKQLITIIACTPVPFPHYSQYQYAAWL